MTKKSRALAVLLACVYAFAVFSSVLCVTVNASHDCVGKGCPICEQTASAEHTLQKLLSAGVAVGCVLAVLFFYPAVSMSICTGAGKCCTLVSLKVKFTN